MFSLFYFHPLLPLEMGNSEKGPCQLQVAGLCPELLNRTKIECFEFSFIPLEKALAGKVLPALCRRERENHPLVG